MKQRQNGVPVVPVIPSLNPDEKLISVVDGLFTCGFDDVIVVDDGSRQDCQPIFDQLQTRPGCIVLHHGENKGKGRALKTAFSYYLENYDLQQYVGVVTADADGQHLPEDIKSTAERIIPDGKEQNTNILALGTRNFNEPQVPFKSRNGNHITTVVFQLLYGRRINDTQTGLRALPNHFVKTCLDIPGERFEYEIPMLIQAVLRKMDIVEVPIQTVYFDNNRETHFHPVKDSIGVYRVMFASFFRFAGSGLISTLVDQGLFVILQKFILASLPNSLIIPVSVVISRICSSLLNYSLNRAWVFEKKERSRSSLVRYYALCVVQMLVSAGAVTGLHWLTHIEAIAIKLVVDTVLFFISYRIQRSWVFRGEK